MGSRTWREQNRTTHGTIPGFTGLGYTFYYCSGCWLGLKAGHEINFLSDDFLFPVQYTLLHYTATVEALLRPQFVVESGHTSRHTADAKIAFTLSSYVSVRNTSF